MGQVASGNLEEPARPSSPSAPAATAPKTGPALAIAGAVFSAAASIRCLDVALPAVAADFGCSLGSAGAAVSAYAISFGAFQLVHGPLGDRIGAYRVVTAAVFLSAILAAACGFARSLPVLVALRFCAGSIAAAIGPLSLAWLSRSSCAEARPVSLARLTGAAILGTATGQAGGGIVSGIFGWPYVFATLTLFFGASALALVCFARAGLDGATRLQSEKPGGSAPNLLSLAKRPPVARVLATVSIEGAFLYLSLAYVGGILHERLGVAPAVAGLLTSLYGAGGAAVVLLAAPLVRRIGASARAVCGAIILGFGLLALGSCFSEASAAAALFGSGVGFLLLHNVLQVRAAEMAPEAISSAMALFAASAVLSQALGAAIGGYLFDHAGATVVCSISAAGLISLGLLLALGQRAGLDGDPGASFI